MEKLQTPYSFKDIPHHSENLVRRTLVSRTEDIISRMRWKLFFVRNPNEKQAYETFGFRTQNSAPVMDELKSFEHKLLTMIANVKFKPVKSEHQDKMREDLKKISESQKVFVHGDKSRNIYAVDPKQYKKEMVEKVTSTYKKGTRNLVDKTNQEAANLCRTFKTGQTSTLADRVDALTEPEAFCTYKDHKSSFNSKKEARLLNPSKTNVGKISKKLLDRIVKDIRNATGLNQWDSTKDTLKWFRSLNDKRAHKFLKIDIVNYYPSIGEALFDKTIEWARTLTKISEKEENIIRHCRKSFLFLNGEIYIKKENPSFDITMGSFDSCEATNLVGLFILSKVSEIIPKEKFGIYRDDFLSCVRLTGRESEKLAQKMKKLFNDEFDLKITVEHNIKTVNFLELTMSLENDSFRPYRKDEKPPVYISKDSDHNPAIQKQLPHMIAKMVSDICSSKEIFEEEKGIYETALKNAGHTGNIQYQEPNLNPKKRSRKRKVLWFNPPWSSTIKSNVAKDFLRILEEEFPPNSELHHYFNKKKVKVSYSNLPSFKKIVSGHNKKVLHPERVLKELGCNCRTGNECMLEGKCLTHQLIYKGTLKYKKTNHITKEVQDITKSYHGLTSTSFKARHSNHLTSFRDPKYRHSTRLSTHIWELKEDGIQDFDLKFSIEKLAPAYKRETQKCLLCLEEKRFIMYKNQEESINKRTEILNKCRHKRSHLLSNW